MFSIYLSITLLLVLIVLLLYSNYLELIQTKQFIIPSFDKQGDPNTYTGYVGRDASKPAHTTALDGPLLLSLLHSKELTEEHLFLLGGRVNIFPVSYVIYSNFHVKN